MPKWRMHFVTASWDEPSDTVIQVPDESGGLIDAATERQARRIFDEDDSAKFYHEEGNYWPVPEGMDFRSYHSETA